MQGRQTSPAGYIAIIVDDLGYNLQPCAYLRNIDARISVSVLPKLNYSSSAAACAHRANKEVLLHLPLEPHKTADPYPPGYIITTAMSPSRVIQTLAEHLNSVPYVVGLNNHMGSKATEDPRLMRLIFAQLKKRNLFFVDSVVTEDSICPRLAKEMNVSFTQRDIFLDNKLDREYIEGQFAQLARSAKENGYAVGIGHPHKITLQIIKEQVDKLQRQGFKITSVEDIIQRQ